MARKAAIQTDDRLREALEEAKAIIEVRHEIAQEAYDFQDESTQKAIDNIVRRLRLAATGTINVRVNPPRGATVPVKIEQQYVDFNLLFIATEIVKDLALCGIRIATYTFPPSFCVACGAEVTNG